MTMSKNHEGQHGEWWTLRFMITLLHSPLILNYFLSFFSVVKRKFCKNALNFLLLMKNWRTLLLGLLFMEDIMEGCHSLSECKLYYLSPPTSVECSRWCELKKMLKIQRKTCWSVFLYSTYFFSIYIFWKNEVREQSVRNNAQVSSSQW